MDNEWQPEITRAICRRCRGHCCTDPFTYAALDYEKKMRKLNQYKYVYRNWHMGEPPMLKKDRTGACVYFDRGTNGCSIYDRRPQSCKAWFCGRGTKRNRVWLLLKEERPSDGLDRKQ